MFGMNCGLEEVGWMWRV